MKGQLSDQEALARLDGVYFRLREKYFPAGGNPVVKTGSFWEWEDLADEFDRELTGTFLEVVAASSGQAALAEPGPCPFCQSTNTKWLDDAGQQERRSKHGAVVLPRQVARCRPCGRSFSPSGATVASGPRRASDAAGGRTGVPRDGGAAV